MRYERIKVLEWDEFIKVLETVKSAKSARSNRKYVMIRIEGKNVVGQRESGKEFKIDIDQLFLAHVNEPEINTTILKEYIKTRAQSPSLAILFEMGIVEL